MCKHSSLMLDQTCYFCKGSPHILDRGYRHVEPAITGYQPSLVPAETFVVVSKPKRRKRRLKVVEPVGKTLYEQTREIPRVDWVAYSDEKDPAYAASCAMLLSIACNYARKFTLGSRKFNRPEAINGQTEEDLAMIGVSHVLMKARKIDKVPSADRWKYIRTMLWNAIQDEYKRFRNKREVQPFTVVHEKSEAELDSNEVLDLLAGGALTFDVQDHEVQHYEKLLDRAFRGMGDDEVLIKLYHGLYRDDNPFLSKRPSYIAACKVSELVPRFGASRFIVQRRIKSAEKMLRIRVLQELKK